jgi:hypothetical protein
MWSAEIYSQERIGEFFRASHPSQKLLGIGDKRIGDVTEKIYYYPADISDDDIESGDVADDGSDMLVLDPSEYSVYKRNGDFIVIVSCNRNKIITDELGNQISVDNDSVEGIFTKFRGFMTLELGNDIAPLDFRTNFGEDVNVSPYRYRLKFPQYAARKEGFGYTSSSTELAGTIAWRKQHKVFEGGKFYSVARFHGLTFNNWDGNDNQQTEDNGFFVKDTQNNFSLDKNNNIGLLITEDDGDYDNGFQEFPSNGVNGGLDIFGAAWMNLSVHLPQAGYSTDDFNKTDYVRTNDNFARQKRLKSNSTFNRYYLTDNTQPIAANDFNTKWFARSDVHWTDIIEVPVEDVINMSKVTSKGFTELDPPDPLNGTEYRNGTYMPSNWTVTTAVPLNADEDPTKYFYKGWGPSDVISFLIELGIA